MSAYTSFAIEDYVTQVGQGTIKDRRASISPAPTRGSCCCAGCGCAR